MATVEARPNRSIPSSQAQNEMRFQSPTAQLFLPNAEKGKKIKLGSDVPEPYGGSFATASCMGLFVNNDGRMRRWSL